MAIMTCTYLLDSCAVGFFFYSLSYWCYYMYDNGTFHVYVLSQK